jgi:thiol-disulfide isomerase/thioredoxin
MKALLVLCFLSLLSFTTPRVSVVTFDDLQHDVMKNNDTLYVVNFWATWCDPCVKELPFFQSAYGKFAAKKVKMVYVSMNSAKEIASVEKFVEAKDMKPEAVLLGSNNANIWINKVDSSWTGAIPATVLYRHGKKLYFHEGDFNQDKLNNVIKSNLK